MKLITPQEARKLLIEGLLIPKMIKCRLTRQAETNFIEFLNYHGVPHGDLSNEIYNKERQMVNCLCAEYPTNPKTHIFSKKEDMRVLFEFTDDMFLFLVE